jgi:hypothetical protein
MAITLDGTNGVTTPDLTVDTTTLTVDTSNNRVGIGTTSPPDHLSVVTSGSNAQLSVDRSDGGAGRTVLIHSSTGGQLQTTGSVPLLFGTADIERMRVDTSGNLHVGKTTTGIANAGLSLRGDADVAQFTRSGDATLELNRLSSDGRIQMFYKDGSHVGSIGVNNSYIFIGVGNTNLRFHSGANAILPADADGASRDNAIDLGTSSARFDDIYATNGSIQTSDQNEKQQIASLTTAEITAAKAISALFKTFKWNDKVEAKGDDARIHTGVIAQEVQTALSNTGLDAADYAFWCSDTWWETSTDVPAVEAVDEVTDEDGNVTTEAVEAKDAYTRIDTYETADEAPDGATQRTRMGIRYPELLAFVGAATEQRLADIETRLTALEAE